LTARVVCFYWQTGRGGGAGVEPAVVCSHCGSVVGTIAR
jgi:hypothetical protein